MSFESPARTARDTEHGFTLIEILVSLFIVIFLTANAVASLPSLTGSMNRNSARQTLETDLSRARSEAVREGARVIVSINTGGNSYTVGYDRFPYGATPVVEETLFSRKLPRSITLTSSATLIFDSRGYTIAADGSLSSTVVSLYDRSRRFLSARVYPAGTMEYL